MNFVTFVNFVCMCVCVCAHVRTADTLAGSDTKLTVEDLFSPDFYVHDPEAHWINGKTIYTRKET